MPPDYDPLLLAQIREAFGRIVYSHKTHEKQADTCLAWHKGQQGALVVLTGVSSGTFLAALLEVFGEPVVVSLVTSSIALLVTVVSLATKTFRHKEESDAHRDVASQLWGVRESYLSLIADLMSGEVSDNQARRRRDELQEAAHSVYSIAPRTGKRAFGQAQEALKENDEMTFTPAEIDQFLPEELRISTTSSVAKKGEVVNEDV